MDNKAERERAERAKALLALQQDIPHMTAAIQFSANYAMLKFKALVNEGFTEAQALELCKVIP
jgi:hypothetical protein